PHLQELVLLEQKSVLSINAEHFPRTLQRLTCDTFVFIWGGSRWPPNLKSLVFLKHPFSLEVQHLPSSLTHFQLGSVQNHVTWPNLRSLVTSNAMHGCDAPLLEDLTLQLSRPYLCMEKWIKPSLTRLIMVLIGTIKIAE